MTQTEILTRIGSLEELKRHYHCDDTKMQGQLCKEIGLLQRRLMTGKGV